MTEEERGRERERERAREGEREKAFPTTDPATWPY
jgi:hypothetical protein